MGRVRWRGAGIVGVVLAVGGVLGACTGSAQPAATTPPPVAETSAVPSPTPTPTPAPSVDVAVPPQRPEAMATPSADGAAAAASYFISLYPYIYATGDTAAWREMSAESCDFCEESATDAETLVASGKRGGAPLAIESVHGSELTAGEWFSARLRVVQPPTTEIGPSGDGTQTSEGGTYDFDFALTWAGRWIVDSVGIQPVTES